MSTLNAGETLQPFKPLRNNLIFDSSGNLVGIQNDRANGKDFRIGGGSGVDGTFATLVATTAIKINSGATLELYNTADQTTNYERLRASFTSNRAEVGTFYAGTGTSRQMRVGAGTSSVLTSYLGFYPQQFPFIEAVLPNTGSSGVLAELFKGTFTGSAGTQTIASIQPTINQSGTAGYIVLDTNPTETATGSGTKLLQRWAVGGSAKAQIDNSGSLSATNLTALSTLGLATALGTTGDVNLSRDAADTLALRRDANAQIFRVYGTYTDSSNYEALQLRANTTTCSVISLPAGTGLVRPLDFGVGGSTQWRVNTGGSLVALTDNTYDIGASGANRPKNVYIGGSTVIGAFHTVGVSTVAALPAAAGAARAQIFVSDSSVAAAGNFGAIVVGGGANIVPVFCDGTNWRIG